MCYSSLLIIFINYSRCRSKKDLALGFEGYTKSCASDTCPPGGRCVHNDCSKASSAGGQAAARKVDVKLPGKGNSHSHGARPVHIIIPMIKWIRTIRLSIKKSPSAGRWPSICCRSINGKGCTSSDLPALGTPSLRRHYPTP